MAVITPPGARRVHYPESDGKPLGETDLHRNLMIDLIFALKWFLHNVRAYVAGNLYVYFEEGNNKAEAEARRAAEARAAEQAARAAAEAELARLRALLESKEQ